MGKDQQYYERRQAGVIRKRIRSRLDALLFTQAADIRYLCGFTGSSAVLVFARQGPAFFTDGRYTQQAGEEVAGIKTIVSEGNPFLRALQWLKESKVRMLGLDFAHFTVSFLHQVQQQIGKKVKLKDCSGMVESFRMIKDAEEIARIRLAIKLGSALFPTALKHIRPGIRESQVAAEIEYEARRRGAEGMSFETIVAGGARSALPHGRASRERLPQRGFVVLDFGVILTGYCSDMTRTVHLGKPDARARIMYEAVLRAQLAAIKRVRPGVAVSAVDEAARSVLNGAGFGQFFTHSTGHGVGLEIHEAPRIAGKQHQKLQPGMVITVEPGIYIPGEGGVRIEDMVLVTERGCEVLTPTTKRLITI
jgi:Xaa-Pro aminopeptidase